jgi:hypothetical protein
LGGGDIRVQALTRQRDLHLLIPAGENSDSAGILESGKV